VRYGLSPYIKQIRFVFKGLRTFANQALPESSYTDVQLSFITVSECDCALAERSSREGVAWAARAIPETPAVRWNHAAMGSSSLF
jgi:hypothetical protein